MREESKNCPICGASIPENAPQGLCPKCLLQGANSNTESGLLSSTMGLAKFGAAFWPVTTGICVVLGALLFQSEPGQVMTPLTQLVNLAVPGKVLGLGVIGLLIGLGFIVVVLKLANGPTVRPAGYDPWPRRIFVLLLIVILTPLVMLFVPALIYSGARASTPNLRMAIHQITTHSNLVVVEFELKTSQRVLELTPRLEGPRLTGEERTNSAQLPTIATVLPDRMGSVAEPEVKTRFENSTGPMMFRVAFAFPDQRTAMVHAQEVMKSHLDYLTTAPQVRDAIVLFDTGGRVDDGYLGYLKFARPQRVEFSKFLDEEAKDPVPMEVQAHAAIVEPRGWRTMRFVRS